MASQMIKPDAIDRLPHISDEKKAAWRQGLTQLWNALRSAPEGSQQRSEFENKIKSASAKIMTEWQAYSRNTAAGGARPQSQQGGGGGANGGQPQQQQQQQPQQQQQQQQRPPTSGGQPGQPSNPQQQQQQPGQQPRPAQQPLSESSQAEIRAIDVVPPLTVTREQTSQYKQKWIQQAIAILRTRDGWVQRGQRAQAEYKALKEQGKEPPPQYTQILQDAKRGLGEAKQKWEQLKMGNEQNRLARENANAGQGQGQGAEVKVEGESSNTPPQGQGQGQNGGFQQQQGAMQQQQQQQQQPQAPNAPPQQPVSTPSQAQPPQQQNFAQQQYQQQQQQAQQRQSMAAQSQMAPQQQQQQQPQQQAQPQHQMPPQPQMPQQPQRPQALSQQAAFSQAAQSYQQAQQAQLQQNGLMSNNNSNTNANIPHQQAAQHSNPHFQQGAASNAAFTTHPQQQQQHPHPQQQQQQQSQQQQQQQGGQHPQTPNSYPPPSSGTAPPAVGPNNKFPIPRTLSVDPRISGAQSVQVPASRPTYGGTTGGAGMMAQVPVQRMAPFTLEGEGDRVLRKRKLDELVRQVTGTTASSDNADSEGMLAPEVEQSILQLADDFVDDVCTSACKLAKIRGAGAGGQPAQLELRDVQMVLERKYGIRIPGYSLEEVRTVRKFVPAPGWQSKMQAVGTGKTLGLGGGGGAAKNGDS